MRTALFCMALGLTCLVMQSAQAEDVKCEVCVSVLSKFSDSLTEEDRKDKNVIEKRLKKFCRTLKGKDERFCFFIGAREDSATSTIGDITKPMSYFMPADKICDKINQKDSQICELKYEKQMDLVNANFKKMKVKELKKILELWGEGCKGCSEKSDFISKVLELLPKYDPAAAKARAAKEDL